MESFAEDSTQRWIKRVANARHRAREFSRRMPPAARAFDYATLSIGEWIHTLRFFDFSCAYCGFKPQHDVQLTIDHVVPLVKWGPTAKNNCVPACKACNGGKKGLDHDRWPRTTERLREFFAIYGTPNALRVIHLRDDHRSSYCGGKPIAGQGPHSNCRLCFEIAAELRVVQRVHDDLHRRREIRRTNAWLSANGYA